LSRFEGRDRIEGEGPEFFQRVRDAFLAMAKDDPDHYLVLDATGPRDELAGRVWAAVEPLLVQASRAPGRSPGGHRAGGAR